MHDAPRLAELAGGLTVACDLGAGVPPEAALRTAVLAASLAHAAGLRGADVSAAYWAALLRYLGCSGFAHETAPLGAGDDQSVLAAFEAADPARAAEILGLAVGRLGHGQGALARAGAVAHFLAAPGFPRQLAAAHCAQAEALARQLGVSDSCLKALGQIYERWDGHGLPAGLRGDQCTPPARVLHLANALEIHNRLAGRDGALAMAQARRGGHFEPALVDAAVRLGAELFAPVETQSVWDAALAAEPWPHLGLPAGGLRVLAGAFAHYVDLKSPFTLGHSVGVARLARAAAVRLGLAAPEVDDLELAALLHDLGRVALPNGLWDKPGPWTTAERDRARAHSLHTANILGGFGPWRGLASLASSDHERLDGGGYHRAWPGAAITPAMRVLAAADVCQALSEHRSHRRALATAEIARTMSDEVRAGRLDADATAAVLDAAGHGAGMVRPAAAAVPAGLTAREVEVLGLLARGLSNKQVARALSLSPVTVKNHVAHIYDKTGVATRASAALFAVTHGLA